jgi:hypothetical protein
MDRVSSERANFSNMIGAGGDTKVDPNIESNMNEFLNSLP